MSGAKRILAALVAAAVLLIGTAALAEDTKINISAGEAGADDGREPPPAALDLRPRFLDGAEADDDILARLCALPLKSLLPLGGGASISLRQDER